MPKNMERVSPWILSLESIHYLGTSEYFCENFNCEAINWSGVVNVYSMQISLVMSTWFILVMIEMTHHVHHIFGLWQWCNFSWLDFIHTYSIIIKKWHKKEIFWRILDCQESPVLCRTNSLLIYLISKQASLNAFFKSILVVFIWQLEILVTALPIRPRLFKRWIALSTG